MPHWRHGGSFPALFLDLNVRWLDWVQIGLHSWDYRWQHCSFDRSACAVNSLYPHWRNLPVFP